MAHGCRPDLLAVMLLAGAVALPVPVLEATPDAPGRPRLARLVAPGERVELTYRHSMFDVPVRERFEVDARLRLVLEEIRSTRLDIVGYYDIPGAAVEVADGDVRLVRLGLAHERLRVRATAIGDRSLVVGGCAVPLRALAGEGGALTLEVRWRPAVALPGYEEAPCPSPA
ncbi:MAG TPA: DUF1850 domain-containing protein [Thermodesulfobacteriota bacterium]